MVGQKRARDENHNQEMIQIDPKKLKRQKQTLFLNYYRGTFYSKSTSSLMFEMAYQLNKASKEMLWWRIVGLTEQILHEKIDFEEQDFETQQCVK